VLLAREFHNLDQFPLTSVEFHSTLLKRHSLQWAIHGIYRRCFGIDWVTAKRIRNSRASLIHAHFGINGFNILDTKIRLKLPLVTTFYGYDLSELPGISDQETAYKKLFRLGDLFLVEGDHMKSGLVSLGCPEEKVQIQRIAIRLDQITFTPSEPNNTSEPICLLFSARFIEKKGLLDALKAVLKARATRSDFKFKIIGSGPLEEEAKQFIAEQGMEDYVSFLGFLSYQDYLNELQAADIFIQPSKESRNGDTEGRAPQPFWKRRPLENQY